MFTFTLFLVWMDPCYSHAWMIVTLCKPAAEKIYKNPIRTSKCTNVRHRHSQRWNYVWVRFLHVYCVLKMTNWPAMNNQEAKTKKTEQIMIFAQIMERRYISRQISAIHKCQLLVGLFGIFYIFSLWFGRSPPFERIAWLPQILRYPSLGQFNW